MRFVSSCASLSLVHRPDCSLLIGWISDQSHSAVNKTRKNTLVRNRKCIYAVWEQNIHCNKNNIFDGMKTCKKERNLFAINKYRYCTEYTMFKSFQHMRENKPFSRARKFIWPVFPTCHSQQPASHGQSTISQSRSVGYLENIIYFNCFSIFLCVFSELIRS